MNTTTGATPRLGPGVTCGFWSTDAVLIRRVPCGSGPDKDLYACGPHSTPYLPRRRAPGTVTVLELYCGDERGATPGTRTRTVPVKVCDRCAADIAAEDEARTQNPETEAAR